MIGKIGTDIQDNKCGWLVVQALNRVNAEQRKVLEVSQYYYILSLSVFPFNLRGNYIRVRFSTPFLSHFLE